jgi:hypothetical protein
MHLPALLQLQPQLPDPSLPLLLPALLSRSPISGIRFGIALSRGLELPISLDMRYQAGKQPFGTAIVPTRNRQDSDHGLASERPVNELSG